MLITSELLPQGPLSIVHTHCVSPTEIPVIVVLGSFASAKMPVPSSTVQVPIATPTGVFAASVALFTGVQSSWSGPASATAAALS